MRRDYLEALLDQCRKRGFDLTVETENGFAYLTVWKPEFGALFRCTAFGTADDAARYLVTDATMRRLRERNATR